LAAEDLEKHAVSSQTSPVEGSFDDNVKSKSAVWRRILGWGVEENGIVPVPVEQRTDTRVFNLFTIWFTALLCLLPYHPISDRIMRYFC
jgi:hypothetical protein